MVLIKLNGKDNYGHYYCKILYIDSETGRYEYKSEEGTNIYERGGYFFFYNNVIYGFDDDTDSRKYTVNDDGTIFGGDEVYIKQ